MKKDKKIPVLVFRDTNSGEADEVYRLDKKGEGDRFFDNLLQNTERGDIHHLRLEDWTKEQVRLADLSGLAMSGEISAKQEREADKLRAAGVKHPRVQWPS